MFSDDIRELSIVDSSLIYQNHKTSVEILNRLKDTKQTTFQKALQKAFIHLERQISRLEY